MIAQNKCTVEMGKDFLFKFMFEYFIKPERDEQVNDMIHSGLAEEFLKVFEWYASKYYKRGKDKQHELKELTYQYKGLIQIYNFNLFDYVQSKYSLLTENLSYPPYMIYHRYMNRYDGNGNEKYDHFFVGNWDSDYYSDIKKYILQNLSNTGRVKFQGLDDFYELMNILAIFSYFKVQAGVNYINKLLFSVYPELEDWIKSQEPYKLASERFSIACFSANARNYYDIYYVDITSYFDKFKTEDQASLFVEIEKIKELLSTLQ